MRMLLCVVAAIYIGHWYEEKAKANPRPKPIEPAKYELVMSYTNNHYSIYQIAKYP